MSGSHLSRNLATLIRTIGETRSKQQQDEIIKMEVHMLKVSLSLNPKESEMFELMLRLLYIETLGHDGSFAHIHPVNLCQSKNPRLKRVGYLLTTLCINRESKLSILMLSTIQKDLASTNLHHVMYCLTALPKLLNKTIIEGSVEPLVKLLKHPTDLVRKKTLIALQKIHELQPAVLPTYKTYLQQALFDEEPPVCFAAVTLLKRLIESDPQPFKEMTDDFCRILKDIVLHKYPKDYDYHKVPAPWLQIDLLRILAHLGHNDSRQSVKCYDVVEKTLRKSTYYQMHINNAIVMEAIRTIAQLYPNMALIREAGEYVCRFFQKDNHNLQCFGVGCLTQLVKVDPSIVRNWQMQILECLESEDTTLATATVQLLINIANDENTQTIISKLVSLAEKQLDKPFQLNLIKKSLMLIERYSSTPDDYIGHMNDLFLKFEQVIDSKSINGYLAVLVEAMEKEPKFCRTLVQEYSKLLTTSTNVHIIKVGAWVLGEYTYKIVEDVQSIEEIVMLLIAVFSRCVEKDQVVGWVVPAVIKLSQTEHFGKHEQVKQFLLELETSRNIRTHNIAEEFIRLAKFGPALRNARALTAEARPSFLVEYATGQDKHPSSPLKDKKLPTRNETTGSELKLKPYKLEPVNKYQKIGESMVQQGTVALVELQDESILKFTGPKKWTEEGYQGRIPERPKEQTKPPAAYLPQQKPQVGFKPKGPQERRAQPAPTNQKQDVRKINLAKSIFTGLQK